MLPLRCSPRTACQQPLMMLTSASLARMSFLQRGVCLGSRCISRSAASLASTSTLPSSSSPASSSSRWTEPWSQQRLAVLLHPPHTRRFATAPSTPSTPSRPLPPASSSYTYSAAAASSAGEEGASSRASGAAAGGGLAALLNSRSFDRLSSANEIQLFHLSHGFLLLGIPLSLLLSPSLLAAPVDLAMGLLIPWHAHVGMVNVIEDYVPRPYRRLAIGALLLLSGSVALGLLKLNLCGSGLGESIKALWRRQQQPQLHQQRSAPLQSVSDTSSSSGSAVPATVVTKEAEH